jgi:uncharacterized protein YbaP (TraB family)
VTEPDEPVVDLTHRKSARILVIALAVVGVAVAGVVGYIVLRTPPNTAPSPEAKRALADEVCPRVIVPHLYRVTKDGKTSHLLGTRHAGVSLAQFPPSVERAFRDATLVVFESDLDRSPTPRESPTPISELLGSDLWQRYRELVGDEVAERVEHGSVFTATAALILLYEDTSRSLDFELWRSAHAAGKRVAVFETETDTGHLTEMYLGIDVLRAFIKVAHRQSQVAELVRAMLADYCTGNSELGRQLEDSLHKVTAQRTRAWMPKLLPMLADGGVFVAVGSQHVDAPPSLVSLLRDEGFDVQPVISAQ